MSVEYISHHMQVLSKFVDPVWEQHVPQVPTRHSELHLKVQSHSLLNVFTEASKERKRHKEPTGACYRKKLAKVYNTFGFSLSLPFSLKRFDRMCAYACVYLCVGI